MLPMLPLSELTTSYLLNDEQYQAYVRIISSLDACFHPEFITSMSCVAYKLLCFGKIKIKLKKVKEMMSLFNRSTYWPNPVYGWQGFINEFQMNYSEAMIQMYINMKTSYVRNLFSALQN